MVMVMMMHCYFVVFQRQRIWACECVTSFNWGFIYLSMLYIHLSISNCHSQGRKISANTGGNGPSPYRSNSGISHLATLPLSFGRVNQPEGAEDEGATGDDPSRAPHPWIVDGAERLRCEPATVNRSTASSPLVRSSAPLLFRICFRRLASADCHPRHLRLSSD